MTVAISKELEDLRDGCTVDEDGCWIPAASVQREKYGNVTVPMVDSEGRLRMVQLNRLAYAELVGEIPKGHLVRHTCKVRDCFNPKHLFTAPPKERKIPRSEVKRLKAEMKAKLENASGVGDLNSKVVTRPSARASFIERTIKRAKLDAAVLKATGGAR